MLNEAFLYYTHTGLGAQSRPCAVSRCLAVGHASLLCPHCELFFTRSSSPQHGPIFLPPYGPQLSYGPENELGLRFSPSPLPSWGFPAFFWETDGQVNTWAVFRCFILSYRRLAIPRAKGFYCPAVPQKPERCHGGGLIMVSAATLPTRPMWSSGRSASDLQTLRSTGTILASMNRHHYHHYYWLCRWWRKTIALVGLFTRVLVEGSWGAKGQNNLFSRAFLCSLFLGGHKREWQIMVSDVLRSCQPLSV